MPVFRYKAADGAGNPVEGEVEATGPEAARESVWALGYVPLEVDAGPGAATAGTGFAAWAFGGRLSGAQRAGMTRELAVLVDAGLPVDRALRILIGQGRQPARRDIANALLAAVLAGRSLADAMEARADVFASDSIAVVRAGEASGRLGPVLMDLASLLERREEVRSRTRSALAYPAFMLVVAGLALAVIIGVLVPSLAPIFQDSGQPMPGIVSALLAVRDRAGPILAMLVAIPLAATVLVLAGRTRPALRRRFDAALLGVPLFGELLRLRDTSRYLATLATLVGARVPLVGALATASQVLRNAHMRAAAEEATGEVREGATLAAALSRHDVLPAAAMQLIGVGEETGRLADMLGRSARLAELQERTRTDRLLSILAPALTVVIAAVVGSFIFSVVGALLDMNDAVLR